MIFKYFWFFRKIKMCTKRWDKKNEGKKRQNKNKNKKKVHGGCRHKT